MSITIGVHRSNPSLYHLSRLGLAEQALAPLGETVAWHRYTDGTNTARLLADGLIDLGGTGSTPPLTGQAQGHDIVYVAVSAPRPEHGALLVAADGPVRTVADLAGRTVVFGVGSWQTHLLAKALHDAGLSYSDIVARRPTDDPTPPAERLAAGEIAGWVAQEAELAAARRAGGVRVLVATGSVISDRSVFFTRRDLARRRPEVVAALVGALQRADDWVAAHLDEAAAHAAAELGGEAADWHTALAGLPWRLESVPDAFVAEQQEAADIFVEAGYLDRPITVADARVPALAPLVDAALAAVAAAGAR
ncbi:putative aliphatic sulfonates-binding protein precursor [Micromonospora sp. MW-13]|uniref:ABC transporter substrate-binding protein n=1 Tax=Micromonospora sp. MW-13 TaxID=2094022 RepID=UPI000E451151|nr:ABC transporter substrate-binding protein [Micromonospora sp. MW-13]RGC67718.1 putative aliphatic sulfonates-binding protein precursor [Micromonospora sp. MW-13]